jgi:hypothetical protein
MRRLFRSFERSGVRYLLISGQASILYGAAMFSEDVDVWIDPTDANADRFLGALAHLHARVYKLTPPLTRRNMLAGHGFHFVIPEQPVPIYLDVMGRPPRVGGFAAALRRARRMSVENQTIPVVSPEDLVKLKLTQRLADYDVISNLVRLVARDAPASGRARKRILRWAASNSFRAEDRQPWLRELGRTQSMETCRRRIAREIARHQAQDRAYWRVRIGELRKFFRADTLLPVGTPVSALAATQGP